MKENFSLDKIDRKILNFLQKDNQITNQALAETIGLSAPSCLRRVRQLHEAGIICQNVAIVDPKKVGLSFIVFLNISLERQREEILENFERKILAQPEITQCYFVSGDYDYFIVVVVSDVHAYYDFVRRVFANDQNIKVFRSHFALNRVKYSTKIVIEE
jgi:Lrp/AsnC family leucine-responsive transcriptional regulator